MPSLTHKLGCLGCTVLLVIASICTWRFGPWYETEYDTSSLTATNSCENCCNGLESNCDLPVNQVLFPAVHNAHSSYENGFVAANNNLPLEEALVAGYRGLMLGSCMCEGFLGGYLLGENGGVNLGFCHSSCSAGVRASTEVLNNVKTFLETNPNEVRGIITLFYIYSRVKLLVEKPRSIFDDFCACLCSVFIVTSIFIVMCTCQAKQELAVA